MDEKEKEPFNMEEEYSNILKLLTDHESITILNYKHNLSEIN